MHNREYTVFLRPYSGGLMLHTMYYSDEVRQVEHFGRPQTELKEAEVKVAHQLIEALAGKFDPGKYHDSFEDNLKQLIQARLEGREVAAVEKARKPAPVTDLMAALRQSLDQMKKGPSPQRANIGLVGGPKQRVTPGPAVGSRKKEPGAPRKRKRAA
jgi:DNA end-binding protein Ku